LGFATISMTRARFEPSRNLWARSESQSDKIYSLKMNLSLALICICDGDGRDF
jgi:hypothetical protein